MAHDPSTFTTTVAAVVSVVAVFGQFLNVFLNLRTSKAILESERRILDRVTCDHPSRESCSLMMADLTRRVQNLEKIK